jgi:hypothetical protein
MVMTVAVMTAITVIVPVITASVMTATRISDTLAMTQSVNTASAMTISDNCSWRLVSDNW